MNKLKKTMATFILLFVASPLFAFSVQDNAPDLAERLTVIDIQNISSAQISIFFSSGEEFSIKKNGGLLIPCSDISGVVMYVKGNMVDNSSELRCGHTYIIDEDEE